MKIIFINSVYKSGSTGKIVQYLHESSLAKNHSSFVFYGRGKNHKLKNVKRFNILFSNHIHYLFSRIFGLNGYFSIISTFILIKKINKINPDVINLHNLHGYYLNLPILFKFLSKFKGKIFFTLHDNWLFTGQCSFFSSVNCDKWKSQCKTCPKLNDYPKSIFDNSRFNFDMKRNFFSKLQDNVSFISPSNWMKSLFKYSFLRRFNITLINNGIDIDYFYDNSSNYLHKTNYHLGVANVWDHRKGLNYFIELANKLPNEKFILVGLSMKQIRDLPRNITGLPRTKTQKELVILYSKATSFINPTLEDNFPTVNIEALASGTPVITFNTGGSSEILNENSGIISEKSVEGLINSIKQIRTFNPNECVDRSKLYSYKNMVNNYLNTFNG